MKFDDDNANIIIRGLMLLFLAVVSNFVGELLPCQLQNFLNNSMFGKHYIVILLIYFTITYPDSLKYHPMVYVGKALLIWIFFLIFTKMNLQFSIICLVLLGIVYLCYTLSQNETISEEQKKQFNWLKKVFSIILLGLIIVGHGIYFMKQRKDHAANWSYKKFIFGIPTCASSK